MKHPLASVSMVPFLENCLTGKLKTIQTRHARHVSIILPPKRVESIPELSTTAAYSLGVVTCTILILKTIQHRKMLEVSGTHLSTPSGSYKPNLFLNLTGYVECRISNLLQLFAFIKQI